jgi:hypothetical protein
MSHQYIIIASKAKDRMKFTRDNFISIGIEICDTEPGIRICQLCGHKSINGSDSPQSCEDRLIDQIMGT